MVRNKKTMVIFLLLSFTVLALYANYNENKSKKTDVLLEEAKYFTDIIYTAAHKSVFNRDYLKDIFLAKPDIDKNMVFFEYLAFYMHLCDRAMVWVDQEARKSFMDAIYSNIYDYICKVSNEQKMGYHFLNFFNMRQIEYAKCDYIPKEDAKATVDIVDNEKVIKFVNMENHLFFEFVKKITDLLNEPIEGAASFKILIAVDVFDEYIRDEIGKRIDANVLPFRYPQAIKDKKSLPQEKED